MKGRLFVIFMGGLFLGATFSSPAFAEPRTAKLRGFQEVPAISTAGTGQCNLRISNNSGVLTIRVHLNYKNLDGNVAQAHIHIAQPNVNGGIVLFLCSNLGNGPEGTPECPGTTSGFVSTTLTAEDLVPVTTQGIDAGELDEVIRAIRRGRAYCNVHTDLFPTGEIRGTLK